MLKVHKQTAALVGGSVQVAQREDKNMTAVKGLVMALVTVLVFSAFAEEDPGVTAEPQARYDVLTEQKEMVQVKQEYRAFLATQQTAGRGADRG